MGLILDLSVEREELEVLLVCLFKGKSSIAWTKFLLHVISVHSFRATSLYYVISYERVLSKCPHSISLILPFTAQALLTFETLLVIKS
jgi:hypothetical protein